MFFTSFKKPLLWAAGFLCLWLGAKYLLPVAMPFLLGGLLAVAAEPLVKLLSARTPRPLAAGVGVSAVLLLLAGILSLVGAAVVQELRVLASAAPDLAQKTGQGVAVLEDWLIGLSEQAPEGMRPALQRAVLEVFDDGTVLLEQATRQLPGFLTTTLGHLGNGLLGIGTGILAAFLISARLPRIREMIRRKIPPVWKEKYLPAIGRVRHALGGWLLAQLKLVAVTFGILLVGFFLLQIPYGLIWALTVALVDAVPILGTGTVLVPWAAICFLQGNQLQGVGLLGIYGAAAITRTVLEPKLVGRHLGLDPLLTLAALYAGYRFWGFLGLLLTPILASAAKSLVAES